MKVVIDILAEQHDGRLKLIHSATNDDASIFDYAGEVKVDDATTGEKIHNTNFDDVLALCVVNVGTTNIVVQYNTDSTPASSLTLSTLTPGGFIVLPQPEHSTSKTVTLFAATAGEVGLARYYVSGD